MTRRLTLPLFLLASMLPALAVLADEISVTAMAPKSAYLGDSFVLQVVTRNAKVVSTPTLESTPDFDARFAGLEQSSSSMQIIINGRTVQQDTYYVSKFIITPKKAGAITIPPTEVTADGRKHRTEPVQVVITEPKQSESFGLNLIPARQSPKNCYVGQYIPVQLEFVVGNTAREVRFTLPDLPEGFSWEAGPDPRPDPMKRSNAFNDQFVLLDVGDEKLIARQGQKQLGDIARTTFTIDLYLLPSRPGHITVGPARGDFHVILGQRPARFTDTFFDDRLITERQFVRSAPFDLNILSLPQEGRPADFTGLIGAFEVFSSVDQREVSIGEPIKLTVNMTGTPPMDQIPPLDLSAQPGFNTKGADGRKLFRYTREPTLPNSDAKAVRFQTTIRVRDASVTAIPPIQLPYFDPDKGQYAVAKSAPITITVRPGNELIIDDSEAVDEALAQASRKPEPLPIDSTPLIFRGRTRFDLVSAVLRPVTLAALFSPPLLCAAVCGTIITRRRWHADPLAARRRRALRAGRRRLHRADRAADRPAAISSALTNLAADWCGAREDSLTGPEAAELLAQESGPAAAAIRAVLLDCDAARFSPGAQIDQTALMNQAAEALALADRQLASRRHSRTHEEVRP